MKVKRIEYSLQEILQNGVLFRDMTAEEIKEIVDHIQGRMVTLEAGEAYCMPGDLLTNVGVIVSGEVLISKIMDSGDENLIQKFQQGYLLGADIAYSTTRINPYYIYASMRSEIWTFPVENMMREGLFSESVSRKLLANTVRFLANENVRKQFKIDVLSQNGLRDRIMSYLMTRSSKLGTNEFRIPFDREEMANYLCVNRSALSHELSLMRNEGLIDFRKNYFRINVVDK